MERLREAAEMALEILQDIHSGNMTPLAEDAWNEAIKALRAAIESPTPEPVAWMCSDEELLHKGYSRFSKTCVGAWNIPVYTAPPQHQAEPVVWQFRMRPDWVRDKDFWEPWKNCTKEQAADYQRVPHLHDWTYESRALYTHPPQRKPLTDDEIAALLAQSAGVDLKLNGGDLLFARAIERAHGIGGAHGE